MASDSINKDFADGLYLDMIRYFQQFYDEVLREVYDILPDDQKKDEEKDKTTKELEDRQKIEQGKKFAKKEKEDFRKFLSNFLSIGKVFLWLLGKNSPEKDIKNKIMKLMCSLGSKMPSTSMFNMDNDSNNLSRLLQSLEQNEPELVLPIVGGQN